MNKPIPNCPTCGGNGYHFKLRKYSTCWCTRVTGPQKYFQKRINSVGAKYPDGNNPALNRARNQ